uniref:Uncharacterized protein n=1 Tax=Rhizobium leguminosarum TaxID=384 RepID=A0A179BJ07_RHILE|nr:hypothetical protein A4U53_27780 [Rhizobium leguminosarum]
MRREGDDVGADERKAVLTTAGEAFPPLQHSLFFLDLFCERNHRVEAANEVADVLTGEEFSAVDVLLQFFANIDKAARYEF